MLAVNGFPERPTLADVAAHAGVSTVTVSRVVEASPKVALKTRERVQAAMDELGYFGNAAATQLVSGRSRTVGVVASNTVEYGYNRVIAGTEQSARLKDLAVLIAVVEGESEDAVRKTVATLASQGLGGVIVIDFDPLGRAVAEALPAYLPAVAATAPHPGYSRSLPSVSIDEYEGSVTAAQHLIGLGHRSIFILDSPNLEAQGRRSRGILDTLDAAHLPHYPTFRCADWSPASGHAATRELLAAYGEAVTAIVCANDEIALGAARAIRDAGLSVPGDVSLVGYDDNPLAAFTEPPLTTIQQDFIELGRLAFDLLTDLIHGVAPLDSPQSIQPSLVIRESTAPPNPARGLR
ncbi:MAG: substrate-binding domain-containing protein [Bifidobacteriaceae bacterium]|jgi:DNA-binding LacI/PurR family transcriptional regulator|nr:substrate-binding domain-containing protein [Bifidobacteriaceae bacterium]